MGGGRVTAPRASAQLKEGERGMIWASSPLQPRPGAPAPSEPYRAWGRARVERANTGPVPSLPPGRAGVRGFQLQTPAARTHRMPKPATATPLLRSARLSGKKWGVSSCTCASALRTTGVRQKLFFLTRLKPWNGGSPVSSLIPFPCQCVLCLPVPTFPRSLVEDGG